METIHKYINPLTDFGFKRLFGTEANVDLLIDFLNTVLPLPSVIVKLEFRNVEQIKELEEDRKAIYDLYCYNERKEEFIIEMQKGKLSFFRDRSLFYLTFPIRRMSEKGSWNFELQPIYYLSIMDFFYEAPSKAKLERSIQLKDDANEIFYKKLMLKFIQLPVFKKEENELKDRKDKWFYFLRNLENLEENMVQLFQEDKIFTKMIKAAEIAKLSPEDYHNYEISRLQYLEIKGVADSAYLEGEQSAREKFTALLQQAEAKVEDAEARIEAERQQKEAERQQKEEAEARAEAERLQKEALASLFVKTLYQTGKTPEEIALIAKMPLEEVVRFIALE